MRVVRLSVLLCSRVYQREKQKSFLYKKITELRENKNFKGNKSIAVYIRSLVEAEIERNTNIKGVSNEQEIINRLVSSS